MLQYTIYIIAINNSKKKYHKEIQTERESFIKSRVKNTKVTIWWFGLINYHQNRSEQNTLSPIIVEVENYLKWKETNIGNTPIFHFHDYGRKGNRIYKAKELQFTVHQWFQVSYPNESEKNNAFGDFQPGEVMKTCWIHLDSPSTATKRWPIIGDSWLSSANRLSY